MEKTLFPFGGIMRPQVHPSLSPLSIATQHLNACELRLAFGDNKWRDYFTFSFVRNPWDRMVTYYLTHPKINQAMTFKEFALNDDGFYDFDRMYSPCFDWLADDTGELLPIDFIGRFENLEQDFSNVCDHLNIDATLAHANKTKNKRSYETYYDEESMAAIARRFESDIDQFGYTFGSPE